MAVYSSEEAYVKEVNHLIEILTHAVKILVITIATDCCALKNLMKEGSYAFKKSAATDK